MAKKRGSENATPNRTGKRPRTRQKQQRVLDTKRRPEPSAAQPPCPLIGRDHEVEAIDGFLHQRLNKGHGGSLYICGSTGTGKTACARFCIDKFLSTCAPSRGKTSAGSATIKTAFLNGNMFNTPDAIFGAMLGDITGRCEQVGSLPSEVAIGKLTELFENKSTTCGRQRKAWYLVLVDEMDQLISKHWSRQWVLYQLFEWANASGSSLILLGIANAIDLHDRYLPDLSKDVQLMVFQAYNRDLMMKIMQQKMKEGVDADGFDFESDAIKFCAGKIASKSGDVRVGLDICAKALTMAKNERAQGPERAGNKMVTFMHMKRSMDAATESPHAKTIRALPLLQKYALCAILRHQAQSSVQKLTVKLVKAAYKSMIRSWKLSGNLDSCDLSEMQLEHLRNNGLIKIGAIPPRKTSLDRSVSLKLDPIEARDALDDSPVLAQLASGVKNRAEGPSMYSGN